VNNFLFHVLYTVVLTKERTQLVLDIGNCKFVCILCMCIILLAPVFVF
jgi:hypothetical protein